MFSTTGLFKDISCPYFLFGLCERPFCHFKHSRHEEAKARIEAEKASEKVALSAEPTSDVEDEYKPPTSSLQRTLQEIENSIQSEKRKLGGHDSIESKDVKRTKDTCVKNKPTGTPEYNPTPLTELKKKKVNENSGRSKYDLALLETSAEGEYDPASNFSTGTTLSSSSRSRDGYEVLPDYANVQGVKRPNDADEDESPLAKIPKFVSVEYTPTVNDSVEFSDEEQAPDNNECFSEEQSGNESESERLLNKKSQSEFKSVENKKDSDSNKDKESLLPIEFTAEGFVKSVYVDQHAAKKTKEVDKKDRIDKTNSGKVVSDKKDRPSSGKTDIDQNHHSHSNKKDFEKSKEKKRKDINIFALFEDEFDSVLDECDHKAGKTDSGPNVKLKRSDSSSKTHKSLENKTNDHKHTTHKSKSHHSGEKHSTSKSLEKSSSSHQSKSSSNRSDKDRDSSHKHSGSSSSSKHKSSSSTKESSSKHNQRTDSSSKSSSSSSRHSSSDNKSKHSDHKKSIHSNQSISNGRHSHSSSKHKDSSHRQSSSNSQSKNGKKKIILSLDVDLFSCTDSDHDASANHTNDIDDDLSDLEKYFVEEDPFDECLRIFNEANSSSTSTASDKKKQKKTNEHESIPEASIGKKRVALKQNSTDDVKRKAVSDRPAPRPSPAQVMMNRYKRIQEQALQAEQAEKQKLKEKVRQISKQNAEKASTSTPTASKPSLSSASSTFTTYMASKNKKTTAITVPKGGKRKAHTPTVPIAKLKRPTVEISTSSKVATNVRQRYLNLFIDECMKIYSTEEEAFKKGKEEEESVYKRCSNKKIYLNFAVNTIKRLRTAAEQKKSGAKPSTPQKKLSHATMLNGAMAAKASYTLHRSGGSVKVQEEDYTGADLYKRLKPYLLTEEQLKQNNYPHPDPEKGGTAIFYGEERNDKKGSTKGYEKLCVRCGKIFEIYPNGKYPIKEECVYHWGKAWKKKIAGSIETRYTCCQGDLASEGCQVAKLHVHETNKKETMSGFMKTIPSSPPIDGDYGVYALDCEMVYTTMGVELARVTVVGADEEPAYESLVRPDNRVVDCNTRFSGITEEDLEDVQTTLRDVQAVLLSLFTDKTILIGHSLESDLIALKLFHYTVVDTSVVFPHRMGYPFKRALKNLMAEYLKKIIQDDVAGHDSLEDALACVQLMQYRLKEDAKREERGKRLSS